MEGAAQGRAASVRIGAGSVPVKDRLQKNGRAKRQNDCDSAPKKNAASAGALRRVEQKNEGKAASRRQSELGRLFRWCIGSFAVAIEPLTSSFRHADAQHVAQLGAVGLALLA